MYKYSFVMMVACDVGSPIPDETIEGGTATHVLRSDKNRGVLGFFAKDKGKRVTLTMHVGVWASILNAWFVSVLFMHRIAMGRHFSFMRAS
tara:strand:+ start:204 stop:476 length:273 start_codon:yes stop_codon:yes gene_type:complete